MTKNSLQKKWYAHWKFYIGMLFLCFSIGHGAIAVITHQKFQDISHIEKEKLQMVKKTSEERFEMIKESTSTKTREEYQEKRQKIEPLLHARSQKVFQDNTTKDFFFDFSGEMLPLIASYIHNEVRVEGFSLNEKGEILLPLEAPTYTLLAKQFLAFHQTKNDLPPLFINIAVQSFTQQEIEVMKREKSGNILRERKKVHKMNMVAEINPEYFFMQYKNTLADKDFEEETSFEYIPRKKEHTSLFEQIRKVSTTIFQNIRKEW
jgi:hypothetical protein